MTPLKLIYDDSVPVSADVTDIVGIRHYGDLLHGRMPASTTFFIYAAAAI